MKHKDRGGVSVHIHTPYFPSEGVSESEGDKPYPRKTQSFHRAVTVTFPSHWFPRLLLPDEDSEGIDQDSPPLFMTMYMIELPAPRLGDKRVPRERQESQDRF